MPLGASIGPVRAWRAPPVIAKPPVGTYIASLKVPPLGAVGATAITGNALAPFRTEVEMYDEFQARS